MTWRRTRAVARKELLHLLRDPRSLGMALALPVVLLLLFGYALTLDVDRIPTLVLDQDRSPESRSLVAAFEGSRYFQIRGRVERTSAIERAIDRDRCLMGLLIRRGFSRRLARRGFLDLAILLDGSDSNTASIAASYAGVVLDKFLATQSRPGERLPVETRLRVWYNSELRSKNYIVPGLLAVILMIIAALLTSLTIAREWEQGTMEQLLATPVLPSELVLGKMSAYFLVGAADSAIAILLGVLVFDVPLRGNSLFLALSCGLFLFGALCWGILVSSVATSQLMAYQMGMITSFLPAFLLSGFIYAVENMPAPIRAATVLIPATHFIRILRGIFLKGVGVRVLWPELVLLTLFAAAVFLIASRRLEHRQRLL